MFYTQSDSTTFTTRLYNNLHIENYACINYWTPPSWFHAGNRFETGSQGLIQTGLSLAHDMRKPKNAKPVSI